MNLVKCENCGRSMWIAEDELKRTPPYLCSHKKCKKERLLK